MRLLLSIVAALLVGTARVEAWSMKRAAAAACVAAQVQLGFSAQVSAAVVKVERCEGGNGPACEKLVEEANPYVRELLQRSIDKKDERRKEMVADYDYRNYKDYFPVIGKRLVKKEGGGMQVLTEAEALAAEPAGRRRGDGLREAKPGRPGAPARGAGRGARDGGGRRSWRQASAVRMPAGPQARTPAGSTADRARHGSRGGGRVLEPAPAGARKG